MCSSKGIFPSFLPHPQSNVPRSDAYGTLEGGWLSIFLEFQWEDGKYSMILVKKPSGDLDLQVFKGLIWVHKTWE